MKDYGISVLTQYQKMCIRDSSYLFVSMAYGIMMENAGFGWYYSLFVSLAFPKGIAAVRSVENAVR